MRTTSHWTPRYVFDRARLFTHEFMNPAQPWLTRDAVAALDTMLSSNDVGFEFGSGRSTVWFANRVKRLTSVEHDKAWFESVSGALRSEEVRNVDYRWADAMERDPASASNYVDGVAKLADGSLDFVLVDGLFRGVCVEASISKLRAGGLLIIDDVGRYIIDQQSNSPDARRLRASIDDDPLWWRIGSQLRSWRHLWTTDGVTDTAIFIKPSRGQS